MWARKGILCFRLLPKQLVELWGCRHVEHMELMVLQRCLKWPTRVEFRLLLMNVLSDGLAVGLRAA